MTDNTNIVPADIADNLPAHLQDVVGSPCALTAAIGGGLSSGESFSRISIKGGRFRLISDGEERVLSSDTIGVAIVGANPAVTKTWYEKDWSPDQDATGPDCSSLDGIRPVADAKNPQSETCATCPHNVFGSKIANGIKMKACPDSKRLAVIEGSTKPGVEPIVYMLSVPPGSMKALTQYQRQMQSRGVPISAAITAISFDTSVSHPKLKFAFGGWLDKATYECVQDLIGTTKVRLVTGEAAPEPAPAPKPAPKPAPVKAAPAPKPAVVSGFGSSEEPAKPAPAPEPKHEPAPTVAAASSDLSPEVQQLADEIASIVGGVTDDA